MQKRNIPLTRTEATQIAQRAFLERITGQRGIWSHLQERICPAKVKRPLGEAGKKDSLINDWSNSAHQNGC